MTSITNGLRELAADPLLGYASKEVHEEALTTIADRIDAELSERYVELPLDADGSPIRVGDDMETLIQGFEGEHSRVEWICLTESGWEVDGEAPSSMRHYQPDTWENIIRDAIGEGMKRELSNLNGGYDRSDSLSNASLVARCKALAGEDA